MRVRIKYMALAREITGMREEVIQTENSCTIMDLLNLLVQRHGQRMRDYLFDPTSGEPHPYLRFLLDGKSVHQMNEFSTMLTDESTLLIVPPVSGG